jgi:hypothetical protein
MQVEQALTAVQAVQRAGQAVQVVVVTGPKYPAAQRVHVVGAGITFVWQVAHPVITSEQIKQLPLKK